MLRVALAQIAARVGDIDGNVERVLSAWRASHAAGADVAVFTELAVTGYPPDDLLLRGEFVRANLAAVDRLAAEGPAGTAAVVGCVGAERGDVEDESWDVAIATRHLRNRAVVVADGGVAGIYDKGRLPSSGVFDEARYFVPEDDPLVVAIAGVPVGVTICEDLWTDRGPAAGAAAAGARVVVNLNASPYHRGKRAEREERVRHHATRDGVWLVYVNVVGGQDDVVFDGDSMVCDPAGRIVARAAQFAEDLVVVDLDVEPAAETDVGLAGFTGTRPQLAAHVPAARLDPIAEVWHALVRATRDYCHGNGFSEALIGLSGGVDSAVTAAVAADALGSDHVTGVAMPSPHSSHHSLFDAEALAANLRIRFEVIPIQPGMKAFDEMLGDQFAGAEPTVAEENIQARLRGVTLMALSNHRGAIVLATGNKSELAVGYATLYGDMAGGFAVLKDVEKTLVYDLARHANRDGEVIPPSTLAKAPSAELRPGQLDQDTLPPYEVLDPIVDAYVVDGCGVDDIAARGFDPDVVRRVVGMIDHAEYKRRQAAVGPKITARAFGRDRRLPITSGWST